MKNSDSVNSKKKKKRPRDEEVTLGRGDLSDKVTKKKKKKRVDTDVDAPRKEKKRKKNGDIDGRSDRGIDRAQSKFERRQSRLNEELESLDLEELARNVKPGERDYLAEYVWLFNSVGRLIRKTEEAANRTLQSKDIYALSTLISQQREIIADIRTLADDNDVANNIRMMILRPQHNNLAQAVLGVFYQLQAMLSQVVIPDKAQYAQSKLEEIVREFSREMKNQYDKASENLDRVASGETNLAAAAEEPKKKKKKKKS